MRRFHFGEGSRLFRQVKVGWTRARLRAHLGDPQRCEGNVWSYVAGLRDGPEVTYEFRMKAGVVAGISSHAVACRIWN